MPELKDASGLWSVSVGLHLFIGLLRNVHVIESLSGEGELRSDVTEMVLAILPKIFSYVILLHIMPVNCKLHINMWKGGAY